MKDERERVHLTALRPGGRVFHSENEVVVTVAVERADGAVGVVSAVNKQERGSSGCVWCAMIQDHDGCRKRVRCKNGLHWTAVMGHMGGCWL